MKNLYFLLILIHLIFCMSANAQNKNLQNNTSTLGKSTSLTNTNGKEIYLIRSFPGKFRYLKSIVVSPLGDYFATNDEYNVRIWSTNEYKLVKTITTNNYTIPTSCFNYDNNRIIIPGSYNTSSRIYDINSGLLTNTFGERSRIITQLKLSPNSKIIASLDENNILILWNANSLQPIDTIDNSKEKITSFDFSTDGSIIATTGSVTGIKLWNVSTGKLNKTILSNISNCNLILFSKDGRKIFCSYVNNQNENIIALDINNGDSLYTLNGRTSGLKRIIETSDGNQIIGCISSIDTSKAQIYFWDILTKKIIDTIKTNAGTINDVALAKSETEVIACYNSYNNGEIRVYDMSSKMLKHIISGSFYIPGSADISPDGKNVAFSGTEGLKILNIISGNLIQKTSLTYPTSVYLRYSTDGTKIFHSLGCCGSGILDISTGEDICEFLNNPYTINYQDISDDDSIMLSVNRFSNIKIGDLKNCRELKNISYSGMEVKVAKLLKDKTQFVTGDVGGSIKLWDINQSKYIISKKGHDGSIISIAVSEDSLLIATCSNDNKIIIWDAQTLTPISRIDTDSPNSLLFYPGKSYLISGHENGTINFWELITQKNVYQYRIEDQNNKYMSMTKDGSLLALTGDKTNAVTILDIAAFKSFPSVPEFISPKENDIITTSDLPLVWSQISNAVNYSIQISDSRNFESILSEIKETTSTTAAFKNIEYHGTLYLRIRTTDGVNNTYWSNPLSIKFDPPTPYAFNLLSPSDGFTGLKTKQEFIWEQSKNATEYELTIFSDSITGQIFKTISSITSTSIIVDGLLNGINYIWSVKAKNIYGTTICNKIWTFTTYATFPDAPVILNPQNEAYEISLNTILTWEPLFGATGYDMEFSSDQNFDIPLFKSYNTSSMTFSTSGLSPATTYYWRLRGLKGAEQGSWRNAKFTTKQFSYDVPVLLSPLDSTILSPAAVKFVWSDVVSYETYDIMISKYPDFYSTVSQLSNYNSMDYTLVALYPNTQYFWKVRGRSNNSFSEWSQTFTFHTKSYITAVPTLQIPANNSENISCIPKFQWDLTYSIQLANHIIEVSDYQDCSSPFFSGSYNNFYGGFYTVYLSRTYPLKANQKYYWRVCGTDEFDGKGPWSEIWNFTTGDIRFDKVILKSPPNNATGYLWSYKDKFIFRWYPVNYAQSYRLNIAKDNQFSSMFLDQDRIKMDTFAIGIFGYGQYYWRVRAESDSGYGEWSETNKFFNATLGVENTMQEVTSYSLQQNYPNPFNPETTIEYAIPAATKVRLTVYDIYGREIETLVNEQQPTGNYKYVWKPKSTAGGISSGIYFYKLQTQDFVKCRKMIFLK